MSLDVRVTDVKNHEIVCWTGEGEERQLTPLVQGIAWMLNPLGFASITEKNFAEVCARAEIWQRIHGSPFRNGEMLTKEHIETHIGLSANWRFKDESRTWFYKYGISMELDKLKREAQDWLYVKRAESKG